MRKSRPLVGIVFALFITLGLVALVHTDEAGAMAVYNKEGPAHIWFDCDDCFSPGWEFFGKDFDTGESDSYPGESGVVTAAAAVDPDARVACEVDDHGWAEIRVTDKMIQIQTYHANGSEDCFDVDAVHLDTL